VGTLRLQLTRLRQRTTTRTPSFFRLRVTQRLLLSWTRWSLKRVTRRLPREELRLQLMLVQQDRQLLLLKELSQSQQMLEHRLQERTESRRYRLRGLPVTPENQSDHRRLEMRVPVETDLRTGRRTLPS
jgi:hypothetical protein